MTSKDFSPFRLHWLDSSYQETCLPDSPWQKIVTQLEPSLAQRIRQQFSQPQRRQILIELLGVQFQRKFFASEPDCPHLLKPPHLTEEQRQKLENEAKSWIWTQTYKTAIEIRAAIGQANEAERLSIEMREFINHTDQILTKSLEQYLSQVQREEFLQQQIEQSVRGTLKTSAYTEILSSAVVSILKRDVRRIIFVKEKLFGQQLSNTLRQWIWAECLFRLGKKPFNTDLSSIELEARREFVSGVRRGQTELKLVSPLQTPVTNLIENTVIETYSSVSVLKPFLQERHLRFTIKILNVLYTYRKSYESYSIYWLLPFQITFRDETNQNETMYLIAMHLNLFVAHCFPQWSNIFLIAKKIIAELLIHDEEFHRHLHTISKRTPKINPKDFVTEIISLESGGSRKFIHELISDPVIYLRKWIGQLFVGILSSNALLYLWDQLFLMQWSLSTIESVAKMILYLLRDRFMLANDYEQMRKIFLDEPSKLRTKDIQTAFLHLIVKKGDSRLIPSLNRRIYASKSMPSLTERSPRNRVGSIGLKNLLLTLVVSKAELIETKNLLIDIEIYEGIDKLASTSTTTVPLIRNQQILASNWEKFSLEFVDEKLFLTLRETRQSFGATRIQALLVVRQQNDIYTQFILGHCRFPLYIPRQIGQLDTWDVTSGPVVRALHPGIAPSSIEMIPEEPRNFYSDKLGPGSNISLVVFDPKAEAHLSSISSVRLS